MITINKMFLHNGKLIFEDNENRWFQIRCVTSDLVTDTYGDVYADRIEKPELK